MKCSFDTCPGEYEPRLVSQSYELNGEIIVVRDIPVEVCPVCGDSIMTPETARRIEEALEGTREPEATAPVFRLKAG